MIEPKESLRRGQGCCPFRKVRVGIWPVEGHPGGRKVLAIDKAINRPPMGKGGGEQGIGGAAPLGIQGAGGIEQPITKGFKIKAAAVLSGQPTVVGIRLILNRRLSFQTGPSINIG